MIESITPYFFALFLVSIIVEAVYSSKKSLGLYERNDTFNSIALGLIGVVTRILLKGVSLLLWMYLYELAPYKIPRGALTLVILFFLNELIYYWFHRISHEVRFFWATHVNHHSSEKMNFSVATRTPFMNAAYHTLFWLPLPLMGFHPFDILAIEIISFFFAFFQHTRVIPKLGVLELFLNTPSHHRVHHAKNKQYLDKNYGNVLIIYDRLFGTFIEETEAPEYGITRPPKSQDLLTVIFHEWTDIIKNGYRLKPKT